MTRCHTGGNLPRITHKNSYNRVTMRYNPIYHFRNPILCIILLSILSQKTITNNWTRIYLAANGNPTLQPHTSTPTKYSNPTCFRGNCNMSTSQPTRKQRYPSNPRPILYSPIGNLLHRTTSLWIHRSTFHNCRLHIRINILYSNRIPRSTRNYRNNLPNHMFTTPNNPTLLIKPPLRVRSSSMILTLRRRSMTFPIHLNLLMR